LNKSTQVESQVARWYRLKCDSRPSRSTWVANTDTIKI